MPLPPETSSGPLVSIITPTLNQGRFIGQTIRSLELQTYERFEHIVIDGGSTDDTLEILKRHEAHSRMRWLSERDSGMYAAVNKGLGHAQGEVHAYLNSDDLYFPWTLEVAVRYLELHPEVDVVYGDALNVDDVTRREHIRVMPAFDLGRLIHVWPLPQPAVFWRANVTRELGGFDSSLKYVGDWDFFIRAGRRFRIRKIDEFLAVERRHFASKTLGEASSVKAETDVMLRRYQPADQTAIHSWREKLIAFAARRVVWLRLLREVLSARREADGPWQHLLSASSVTLSVPRLLAGFVPWSPPTWKAGAVSTGREWLTPH